jgi:hypothetical protein
LDPIERPYEVKQKWIAAGMNQRVADDPNFRFLFVFKANGADFLSLFAFFF